MTGRSSPSLGVCIIWLHPRIYNHLNQLKAANNHIWEASRMSAAVCDTWIQTCRDTFHWIKPPSVTDFPIQDEDGLAWWMQERLKCTLTVRPLYNMLHVNSHLDVVRMIHLSFRDSKPPPRVTMHNCQQVLCWLVFPACSSVSLGNIQWAKMDSRHYWKIYATKKVESVILIPLMCVFIHRTDSAISVLIPAPHRNAAGQNTNLFNLEVHCDFTVAPSISSIQSTATAALTDLISIVRSCRIAELKLRVTSHRGTKHWSQQAANCMEAALWITSADRLSMHSLQQNHWLNPPPSDVAVRRIT